jgi:hypothetical protein
MTIGTEHAFSISDPQFSPLLVSDMILKKICGSYESEILFGDIRLGKELQKTVLVMVPRTTPGASRCWKGSLWWDPEVLPGIPRPLPAARSRHAPDPGGEFSFVHQRNDVYNNRKKDLTSG